MLAKRVRQNVALGFVEGVVGQQPRLVASEWLVHRRVDLLLGANHTPDAKFIDCTDQVLRAGVVGEADVDVFLPVEVGGGLGALGGQFAVDEQLLALGFAAKRMCHVMPLAIGQV